MSGKNQKTKATGRRKSGNEKAIRLIGFLRRAGLYAGLCISVIWAASWLWFGGFITRGAEAARDYIYQSSVEMGFSVQDILVEGRSYTEADVLKAIMDVQKNDPILAIDPAALKSGIERIPWVKTARVERRLPSTLYVSLQERVPMALWQEKGKVRLIDTEGVVLTDSPDEAFRDFVVVVGKDAPKAAPEFLAILRAEPFLYERTEAIKHVSGRRWDMVLKDGIEIKLPEDDIPFALSRLSKAVREDGLLKKNIVAVDLREEDRMTVQTRPGKVEEFRASFQQGGSPI